MPSRKQPQTGISSGMVTSPELEPHVLDKAASRICSTESEHYVTYCRSQPTRLGSPSVAETSPALNTPHIPQPLILSVLLSLFLKYLNLLPPDLSEIPSVLKNAAQRLPSP